MEKMTVFAKIDKTYCKNCHKVLLSKHTKEKQKKHKR